MVARTGTQHRTFYGWRNNDDVVFFRWQNHVALCQMSSGDVFTVKNCWLCNVLDSNRARLTRSSNKKFSSFIKTGVPEFYLHHGFIDKIWDDWQKRSEQHKNAYYGSISTPMTATIHSPSDVNGLENQPGIFMVNVETAKELEKMQLLNRSRCLHYLTIFRVKSLNCPSRTKLVIPND